PISTSREPLELAERAHALAQTRPSQALVLAEEALALARVQRDREARVAALHALGFALYVLGDPRGLTTIREAVRRGERDGYAHRAALARRHLAGHLAYAGRTREALLEIEKATAALTGLERARSEVFRVAVVHLAGTGSAGLAGTSDALRVLQR